MSGHTEKMEDMDVGALAMSKISSMVGRYPRPKTYVSTNDNTPITVGYIDLRPGRLGW